MAAPVEKPGLLANADDRDVFGGGAVISDVIEHDLFCRTCGYNLRGLGDRGRCPECDTPIDRSTRGDLLRYCDPRWVRTIARGLRIINIAVVLGLIGIIGLAIFARSLGLPWLIPTTVLVVGAVMTIGVWLATEREPATVESERLFSTRRVLRVLVISAIVLQLSGDMLMLTSRYSGIAVRLLALAIIIAGIFCAFRYAASLARRIPDPLLLAQTRGVMWGLIISYGLFLMIAAMALTRTPMPSILAMVFGLSCTVFIACIVFTLWTLTLISRYAARLQYSAIEAELSWTIDAERAGAESPR